LSDPTYKGASKRTEFLGVGTPRGPKHNSPAPQKKQIQAADPLEKQSVKGKKLEEKLGGKASSTLFSETGGWGGKNCGGGNNEKK